MRTFTADQVQSLANKAAAVASNTTYCACRELLRLALKGQTDSKVSHALKAVIKQLDELPAIEGIGLYLGDGAAATATADDANHEAAVTAGDQE